MPRSFVVVVRVMLVRVLRSATVAPGTASPEALVTVPRMMPVVACDWARNTAGGSRTIAANATAESQRTRWNMPPPGFMVRAPNYGAKL